ncbi:hypothetical protein BC833DRAFT_625792 [Globomyces pollinis-pini]|nr:hypothetical protein BC833DRAFT_625792 [Globomyces pollinis-pini]
MPKRFSDHLPKLGPISIHTTQTDNILKPNTKLSDLSHGLDVDDPLIITVKGIVSTRNLEYISAPSLCTIPFFNKLAVLKDDWLEFQEKIPLTKKQKAIFIRQCYKELAGIIIQNGVEQTQESSILSGTPGIGKSLFLIYILFILTHKQKRVLYVCDPYMIYYDIQGRVFHINHHQVPPNNDLSFWNKDLWLLFDAKNKDRIEDCSHTDMPYDLCTFVLSTSPKRKIINDAKKTIRTLFMPVWSETEIQVLAERAYPGQDWKSRYVVLGGVPRLVLENTDEDSTDIIREACDALTVSSCISLVISGSIFTDKSKDVIHRLVHMYSSSDYKKQNVGFGSDEISRIIAYQKRKHDITELYCQIESACSHPKTSSLGGYLFEFYAFDLLEKGGSFKCRKLVHGNVKKRPRPYEISIKPSVRKVVKEVTKSQIQNQLYVPVTSNYAAIDAWIPGVGGFNMTVAKSHDIKGNAAHDLALLGKNAKNLYWLLPPTHFDNFKKKSNSESIDQYALLIPFSNINI